MGNCGLIFPHEGFLEGLREIATDNDIVLIFDEVVTGFRIAAGGASEYYGVKPDLHTFAKALANGYPISAFGGKNEIMSHIGLGNTLHGGTHAGNPLTLAAAHANLTEISKGGREAYTNLHNLGKKLIEGLKDAAERTGHHIYIPGFAGFYTFFFTKKEEVNEWRDIPTHIDEQLYSRWVWEMYKRGIFHGTPEAFERENLTMSHTIDDVNKTIQAAEEAFKAL